MADCPFLLLGLTALLSGLGVPLTTWIMVGIGLIEPFEFTVKFKKWEKL